MKRPFLAIIIGIIVIIAAILFSFWERDPSPKTPPQPAVAAVPAAKETAPPSAATKPRVPEKEKRSDENALAFDIVRINPDGNVVIAGRAAPNTTIQIFNDDALLGETTSDQTGSWVFLPSEKLSPGQHRLTLREKRENEILRTNNQPVFLIVPEPEEKQQAPLAVTVPEKGDIAPLQEMTLPADMSLSIDVVQSDAQGAVTVSGKGPHGAEIRLYIDKTYKGKTLVPDTDNWKIRLETALGDQPVTVRADQVDAQGKVIARVEVGFVREKIDAPSTMARVVVQPGNSLWRIARRTYGDGFDYVIIYRANKDQIRNPDMIFPGQVYMLPKPEEN